MHNTSVASIGICSHRKLSLHHLPREKGLLSPVHRWDILLDALALPMVSSGSTELACSVDPAPSQAHRLLLSLSL